jgi:hypothetical protein
VQDAQARVANLVRNADLGPRGKDINVFARAAAKLGASDSIALIGIEEADEAKLVDTFGWLTFLVTVDSGAHAQAGGPYCFCVAFNCYGKVDEWGTSDGVMPEQCPKDAAPVAPQPDETIKPVVAVNAREVAHEVLARLPASGLPSSDEIAAQVASLLSPPDGDHTVTAPPAAVVEGSNAGIAMGGPDDCVLVSRVNGGVGDVYPPRVSLQPGELGCTPSTALTTDLRPPH